MKTSIVTVICNNLWICIADIVCIESMYGIQRNQKGGVWSFSLSLFWIFESKWKTHDTCIFIYQVDNAGTNLHAFYIVGEIICISAECIESI